MPNYGGYQLSSEQVNNAKLIARVGRSMGASARDIQIAIMTAMTESSLRNLNYGDRDSLGLFQQRAGWGSVATRTDPARSSSLFFKALFKVKDRNSLSMWGAAQTVQRSAYSDGSNYRAYVALGQQLGGGSVGSQDAIHPGDLVMAGPEVKVDAHELAEQYGFAYAFLRQHKDLKRVFDLAVANTWSTQKFIAELRGTHWWKTTEASVRAYQMMATADPAGLKQLREQTRAQIADRATKLGAVISSKQLTRITENAVMFKWNGSQLDNTLADYIRAKSGIYSGSAETNHEALAQMAFRNGLRVSSKTMDNWVRAIAAGNQTADYYQGWIRQQAKMLAPAYADQIDGGQDLMTLADHYIQSKAAILQLDPEGIDLFDPDVRAALSSKDDKGKPTSKSLWQFENEMRNKPEYMKTDAARGQAYQIANRVLTDFGFLGGS